MSQSPSTFTLQGLILCILIFLGVWYDTIQGHAFTAPLNTWILEYIYVAPSNTYNWDGFYHHSLSSLTALGSDIILFLLLVTVFADLLIKKEIKILFYCVAAVLVIFGFTELCKQLVYSPRPMFPLEHDSFPSGHTARVSIWCGIILLLNQIRFYSLPRCWQILLWSTPFLVAFTRLGLGRHWLSDVIASISLSFAVFLVAWYFLQRQTFPLRKS